MMMGKIHVGGGHSSNKGLRMTLHPGPYLDTKVDTLDVFWDAPLVCPSYHKPCGILGQSPVPEKFVQIPIVLAYVYILSAKGSIALACSRWRSKGVLKLAGLKHSSTGSPEETKPSLEVN
jgi:hypothetical protein